MAAVVIRDLLTRLGVESDTLSVLRFDAALNIAVKTMNLAVNVTRRLTDATFGLVVATAEQGDEAAKAAKRVGITAQEMQELGFAAEQSGARLLDIEVAMRRQATAARDAAKGTGIAGESYKKLGVNVRDATGKLKPQLQLLEETADALPRIATETEQLAIINDIFGRGGARIRPLLSEGAEGIRKFRQEARDLGFVLDEEATKASEEFIDSMNAMRLIFVGLRNEIGKRMLPVFNSALATFRDFVLANRDLIRARLEDGVKRIRGAFDRLLSILVNVDQVVEDELGGWAVIFEQIKKAAQFSGVVTALTLVGTAAKAANLALLGLASNPIVLAIALIAAGLVAAVLAGEDFIVFLRGGKSALGDFLDSFGRADEVRDAIFRLVDAFGNLLEASRILDLLNAGLGLLGLTLEDLKPLLFDALDRFFLQKILAIEKGIEDTITVMNGLATAIDVGIAIASSAFDALNLVIEDITPNINAARQAVRDFANSPPVRALLALRRAVIGIGQAAAAPGTALAAGAAGTGAGQGLAGFLAAPGATAAGALGQTQFGAQALRDVLGQGAVSGLAAAGGGPIIQGDTITINGGTLTVSDIEGILERRRIAKNRQAIGTTRGGER